MAKEYKFEYELVTYKWPHWLRKQSEKQRTIWGQVSTWVFGCDRFTVLRIGETSTKRVSIIGAAIIWVANVPYYMID